LPERQIRGPTALNREDTLNLLKTIAPDVILFADGCAISNQLAKSCARELSIPVIFSIGLAVEVQGAVARQIPDFQEIFEFAHSVVAVSRQNAEVLARHYPIGVVQLKVIHYGRLSGSSNRLTVRDGTRCVPRSASNRRKYCS
jgi:hypothetical protein